jgi:hypothetical protein
MTSDPGAPGTTPPLWKCGSCGALIVLPPMSGTQAGTLQLSEPIVLFQASETKLNAALNGAVMKSLTLPKTWPIFLAMP